MNDKEYDAMQGVRRSDLWHMKKSPAHMKYFLEHDTPDSPALLFGRAYHKWILENKSFFDEFYVIPSVNRRTKEGRAILEQIAAENAGKQGIESSDLETIKEMAAALDANPETAAYRALIDSGKARTEVPFVWIDKDTGEMCKVKADMIIDERAEIVDFKTATSCEDGAFERASLKYGYNYQAAFYTEGIDICTMEKHTFTFIAQEKTPPYAARVYECDEGFIDEGRTIFHLFLRRFHNCRMAEEWPGYESQLLIAGGK